MVKRAFPLFFLILLFLCLSCHPSGCSDGALSPEDGAISKGMGYLAGVQTGYGEFPTYISSSSGKEKLDSTPFVTCFVLTALLDVEDPRSGDIFDKGTSFLLSEQYPGGLWRYFGKRNNKKIVPDIDDMSTISFLLTRKGVRYDDNSAVIEGNRDSDGIYYTWVGTSENDIDSVVNANVALWKKDIDDRLYDFLMSKLGDADFSSYYVSRLAQHYMYARAYRLGASRLVGAGKKIIEDALKNYKGDGSFGSVMDTSFAANALLDYGYSGAEVDAAVDFLLKKQNVDGSWSGDVFYKGPFNCGDRCAYFRSDSLATALTIEAIDKHRKGRLP